jgi:poly(beta-D-mannuronate) C5 epimerase
MNFFLSIARANKKELTNLRYRYILRLFFPIRGTPFLKCLKRKIMMMIISKAFFITAVAAILIFSMTGISYQQVQLPFEDEEEQGEEGEEGEEEEGEEEVTVEEEGEEEQEACIDYDAAENTIAINCNASFLDVVQAINDPEILENAGDGEYILNANLEVADGVTFAMTSNEDGGGGGGLQYLKITGANGIIVYGRIEISGIIITSWDTEANSPIFQTITGSVPRAFINLRGSEGGFVHGSEIAHLGYTGSGLRGFDLYGDGPSHDLEIRGSEFHNMWFAFFSNGAYNIVVDGNEYHHNIKYALDPHTGTYNMSITNNWLHHNPIGAICSLDCYNILIEGNLVEHNRDYGIFFSRNMTDSIARNNQIYNVTTGIMVSESPNNQIYDNTIEAATSQGIRLQNPVVPDDGFTEENLVYNNTIISSSEGIGATRSQNDILENNTFSNITSSEYLLSGNAGIIIRGQNFDNTLIAEDGSATENFVEIVDSGTIEVTEIANDGEEGGDNGEGAENSLYNTANEPYRKRLSDGDSIIVNS